jgi:hypothetical protein
MTSGQDQASRRDGDPEFDGERPHEVRHFEAGLLKSSCDLISKPSVSIHSFSQITTAGSVLPDSRASVVFPAPAFPQMK